MTLKSLTILDIDLIDSNEAILVLNNLPNVQILNGKNTKEEEEEFEEDENNENINTGNHLEEIQEDKNMENNSNYISSENNIASNNFTPRNDFTSRSDGIHNNKLNGNIINNETEVINKKNDETNNEVQNTKVTNKEKPNTILYDKIISDESNKKIISTDNEEKKEIANINKNYYFPKFMIDITNEELNLLNEDRNNFPIFLQEFNELFPKNEENGLINIYNNKIQDIENKKGNIPNYYYFYLIIKKKISILKNLFDEMFPFILNNCPELNKNDIFIKLYTEIIKVITSSKQLLLSLHKHLESFNNKSSIDNQNETNYNNELNKIIIENNETISKMKSEKNSLLKKVNEDKSRYELKIKKLEKENEVMTNKLINNMNLNLKTPYTSINLGKNKINFKYNNIIKDKNDKNKSPQNISIENSKNNKSPYKSNMSTISNYNNFRTISPSSNTIRHQSLSLKALKEFINELYISKNNYNIKCEQFKLPKDTLEEHMYAFLNKKYGLKNIVIDWAKNIIQGIKKYSKIDSTVLLFAKILKNEQEEEAQFIIQKVTNSIQELLKFYLKKQNPLKSVDEIDKMSEIKKNSELNEEEWKGIIYSIYEQKEAEEIEKKIEQFINNKKDMKKSEIFEKYKNTRMNVYNKYNNNIIINYTNLNNNKNDINNFNIKTINSFNNGINNLSFNNNTISPHHSINGNKMTRSEKYNMLLIPDNKSILYNDFIRIVLNSHIRFRDRQLKNFVKLFQSVDLDRDGILNEEEFRKLVQNMNIFKEEEIEVRIFYFLERIDPFDNQKITFSECISFFAGEYIMDNDDNKNGNEISILEKICFKT
jgi:hypothetical protein